MRPLAVFVTLATLSIATTVACAASFPSTEVPSEPVPALEAPRTLAPGAALKSAMAEVSGDFVSGEHPTMGTATLVTEGENRYVEFSAQFRTSAGPDLVVVLHVSPDVVGTTEAPAHSIREGDYVVLAPLQAVSGLQRYTIPSDIDVTQYASVAVWCREFNATFGAAAFQ